jgi:hypothetical protein
MLLVRRPSFWRAYWQVTGRDEESETGTQRYRWGSGSAKTRLKTSIHANSFRYHLTSWRLKILGPAKGVWVQDPPPAPELVNK